MSEKNFVKLAHLVRFGNGQVWKSVEDPNGEFPVYGSGGEFGRATDFLHDGEAVLFGRKGTVDRPLYVNEKFWTVDTMYYAVPHKNRCIGKYLYYWATTIPFKTISTNTALPSVTAMDLSQLYVPLPPLQTQQRIADYLDRETAEIDAAVADLDRYVELLEKRRSMITSDALTGADSVKLAHLVRFRNGQDWKDVATPDGEFPVYGSGGEFGRASNFLHDGEAILFGRKGTVDRPIYVDEKFWTVDTMYYAVPNKDKCLGKYIFYWATTIPFETITTNTALPSVTSMDLSQLYVPLPPLEPQQRIADYLDRETAETDSLIADSTKLRDLLLKRRSVLITEVVTGRKQV
ncbi:restriction endonuclease subunit S [Corynebacterium flavescens]|uniref:restriction endonuclease subunit S n=1 Tax=Corynebacterium flavescens TaxID=28028 RepID=UPI003FD34538